MKIYGFIGVLSHDIVLYLSVLLEGAGKKLLVADYTVHQDIFSCVKNTFFQDRIIHLGNTICIGKDIPLEEVCENQDLLLVLISFPYHQALDMGGLSLKSFTEVFLVTDFQMRHLKQTEILLGYSSLKYQVILRDICSSRLNAQYFNHSFGKGKVREGSIYELFWDQGDYEYRIRLEHEPFFGFVRLSFEFQELLIRLGSHIGEISQSDMKKVYQKAKRGKGFEGCILE